MLAPYNIAHIFDKKNDLTLLFGNKYNGDIYDTSVPGNPRLICSSGAPFVKVSNRSEIPEKIIKTNPSYDATLIRVYFHANRWHLSTRKHIEAFDKTWNPGKYTFGQLFEKFVRFDDLDLHLNRNKAYTFLLLSPDIQNVLPNDTLELIHVYTYDSELHVFEPFPYNRPKFAGQGNCTKISGWLDNMTIKKIIDGEEKTKEMIKTVLPRPQRGFLFTGESGQVYQMDFKYFHLWESIVQNRPWKMVFYDLLKKKVTQKPMEISLERFFAFYSSQPFFPTYLYFQHIAKYIIQCYNQGVTPTQPTILQIWYHILARNHRTSLTQAFVLRQIVYQKYSLLEELLNSEFCPILIEKPPVPTEEDFGEIKTLEDLESMELEEQGQEPPEALLELEEQEPLVLAEPEAPSPVDEEGSLPVEEVRSVVVE
jgi:hypothetical protein